MTEPIRWAEFTDRESHIATALSAFLARIRTRWEAGETTLTLEEARRWARYIAEASERPELVSGFFEDRPERPGDDGQLWPPPVQIVHPMQDDGPPHEAVCKAWGPKGVRALPLGGENER